MINLGAVAYDPKVVTIWEGFREWFAEQGLDFDSTNARSRDTLQMSATSP